jgi:predicted nucleotidyltransferase
MCDAERMSVSVDESARSLRERAQQARAERERRAAQIRADVEAQLRASLPAGGRAWLIGSLAWGEFGERSDVDLVLKDVDAAEASRIEEAVARAAGAPVDLINLDDLPASFRQRVERDGIAIDGR